MKPQRQEQAQTMSSGVRSWRSWMRVAERRSAGVPPAGIHAAMAGETPALQVVRHCVLGG